MPVTNISSEADFDKVISGNAGKLIVVDFFATWCGPCRMISPKIEEFSNKYSEVVFIKVDVDEVQEVSSKCNISAMPTFHFMKDGAKIDDLVGADANKLEELIKKHK